MTSREDALLDQQLVMEENQRSVAGRIACAISFGLLCCICLFLSGGMAILVVQSMTYGWDTPEMFGWLGLFLLIGMNTLVFGSPGAVALTILFFIKKKWSLLRMALISVIVGSVSGVIILMLVVWIEKHHVM